MRAGGRPAALDRARQHRGQPIGRDEKRPVEGRIARRQIAAAGQQPIDRRANRAAAVAVLRPPVRRGRTARAPRRRTADERRAGCRCARRPREAAESETGAGHSSSRGGSDVSERASERQRRPSRISGSVACRVRASACHSGGTVIGVERIGIAVAEREHEAHVRFGRRVERPAPAPAGGFYRRTPAGRAQRRRRAPGNPATKTRKHEANRMAPRTSVGAGVSVVAFRRT